jgi:hypothetical protein
MNFAPAHESVAMNEIKRGGGLALLAMAIFFVWSIGESGATGPDGGPHWERLTSKKAPADALRRYGNTAPPSGTTASLAWERVKARSKDARADLRATKRETSEEGRARYRRALALLTKGNPVICRARYLGQWTSGFLEASTGICALHVLLDTADESECRRTRDMGPDCRPHFGVKSAEIHVLRGANSLHLVHVEEESSEMHYPLAGLVGLGDDVFRDSTPLCLLGDASTAPLGAVEQDGPSLRCSTTVSDPDGEAPLGFAYGNMEMFSTLELGALAAFVRAQRSVLASVQTRLVKIEDADSGKAALARIDAALATFRIGVQGRMDSIHASVRGQADDLVTQKLGRTLDALDSHRVAITAKVDALEIAARVARFIEKHARPLLPELARATGVHIRPIQLEVAQAELARLQDLEGRRRALVQIVEDRLPIAARQKALERVNDLVGAYDKALRDRLQIVAKAVANLEARSRIHRVAEEATVAVANVTAAPKSPEKALQFYESLMLQHEMVEAALAVEESDPILVAHAQDTLSSILVRLDETLRKVEPSLPGLQRHEAFERTIDRLWREAAQAQDSWQIVSLVRNAHQELSRLFGGKDSIDIQLGAVRRWTELRQDVLDHILGRMRLDLDPATSERVADPFRDGLRHLPGRHKSAPSTESARMSKLLKTNGFSWGPSTVDGEDASEDTAWDGPMVFVTSWWRAAKLKAAFDPSVTAWTLCSDAIAADWKGTHAYLKPCRKAYRIHGSTEHMKELAAEIHKGLEGLHEALTWKECVTLRWRYPRAFFVGTIKSQCQIIERRDKKERVIARAKSEIQKYLAKKNFPYARMLLEDLRRAGAEPWEIESAVGAIDAAEAFETDSKARAHADQRVQLLMGELATIERTCRYDLKALKYANNEFIRAVRNGKTKTAERYKLKKQRSRSRACQARRKATEAYAIYEGQGRKVAAESVLEGAQTCFRSWTCLDSQ